jgi:hypothetical protein
MKADWAHDIRSKSGYKYRCRAGRIGLGQAFLHDLSHRALTPRRHWAGELFVLKGRLGALPLCRHAARGRRYKYNLRGYGYSHLFAPFSNPLSSHLFLLAKVETGTGAGK